MNSRTNVGLAFQGGVFLGGAIATGVVHALLDRKVFDTYNINAFSGTSSGALVAAMCWQHKLCNDLPNLPKDLQRQWLENANGWIPTEEWGEFWKVFDRWMPLFNPLYVKIKDTFTVPFMHRAFEDWVVKYVDPEKCMQALFDKYIGPAVDSERAVWRAAAQKKYDDEAGSRPRLVVGTAEIHQGEAITIDDDDLFAALVDAFHTALGNGNMIGNTTAVKEAEMQAIKSATEYMKVALMTSGSLDTMNGMTEIDDIKGISNEALLHKGHYLDGAYAVNPPMSALTNCTVDEIWMVEIFPKRCFDELDSIEKREDRREELSQNALVEHQLYFINKVNFWLKTGRLRGSKQDLVELASYQDDVNNKWEDESARRELIDAFRENSPHSVRCTDDEIKEKLLNPLTTIKTRVIELPSELQPLTDGARIVNSPAFLIDKMNIGYQNTLRFLDQLH